MNDAKQQPAADAARDTKAERYAALLAEAEKIKGVSLWQDARRRLRKNRAAVISFYFLVVLGLLAFLTPLLPFQSPSFQRIKERFAPPALKSASLGVRERVRQKEQAAAESLQELHEELGPMLTTAASQRAAEAATRPLRPGVAAEFFPASAELAMAEKAQQTIQGAAVADSAYEDEIDRLWNHPTGITRGLIYARLAIFGDWCIPSVCGTDKLGRDVLSRLFWGARVSLIVGLVAALVSLVIGVTYGAISGFTGGLTDEIMMRIVDVLYSIPFIFVVIFIITILDAPEIKREMVELGISRIMVFFVLIGAIYWLTMARVVRGQVISLKNEQFIEAARTIGAGRRRLIFRHVIPNVLSVVIVYLTLTIPAVILFESFLSFLGLGVEPPDVSWGMLAKDGIDVITPVQIYWWLILFPGLALALTLFALNFLGDGLRDALDPRMKNR